MGLTKKAKILLSGVASALVLVVVVVPLILSSGKPSVDTEARNRLNDIDKCLQRSLQKMLSLVDQEAESASRRMKRDVNMPELRDLENSVLQLTRSLSDFAEMLNESGFENIVARFHQDLVKYNEILTEIRGHTSTISSDILDRIKIQETAFNEDEKDLFKIETISRQQSAVAGPVILAMEEASNQTKEFLTMQSETDHSTASVSQDNDTVVVLSTNDTSLLQNITQVPSDLTTEVSAEPSDLTTEEVSVEIQAITEVEENTDPESASDLELSTSDIPSTESTVLTRQEVVTEVNTETQAVTEVEGQSTEPEVDREQTTGSDAEQGLGIEQAPSNEQEKSTQTEQEQEQNIEPGEREEERLNNNIDINHESNDDSVFETPIETPDLSDIEYN